MTKHEQITEDGEVIEAGTSLVSLDTRLVSELAKAEIDQQITTARQFPRSVKRASDNILSLATLDAEAAAECIYALPRAGKAITGPSIRLAEIIAGQWGNCRVAARVVDVNRAEKYVEAEGVFHDLETNSATKATVRRRIVDSKGRIYTDDMIIVTGNAACSIARRNAILAGVPRAVWRRAEDAARSVIKGDVKTLSERREKAMQAFAVYGVTPDQIFAALGVAGDQEITLEHIPILVGMYSALKNGEATVEEMFAPKAAGPGRGFAKVANPLADAPSGNSGPDGAQGEGKSAVEPSPASDPSAAATSSAAADGGEGAPTSSPAPSSGDIPSSTPDEAGEGDATAPSPVSLDPVAIARGRGEEAARKGMSRRALPPEYRDTDRLSEANAWQAGFDAIKAVPQPAPGAEG